jgi:hypothetical protein
MTDYQVNKLRSFASVEGVMDDEKAVVEKYPTIRETWSGINTKIKDLKVIAVEKGTDSTGITLEKNQARHNMADLASNIAGCASSNAKRKKNKELAAIFNLSKGKILKYSEERSIALSKVVYKEASKIVDQLQDDMVTQEDLDELNESIAYFEGLRKRRGSTNSTSKVNTKLVAEMIRDITNSLNDHLDKYVNKISKHEPVFFGKYYAARNILDLGGPGRPPNYRN